MIFASCLAAINPFVYMAPQAMGTAAVMLAAIWVMVRKPGRCRCPQMEYKLRKPFYFAMPMLIQIFRIFMLSSTKNKTKCPDFMNNIWFIRKIPIKYYLYPTLYANWISPPPPPPPWYIIYYSNFLKYVNSKKSILHGTFLLSMYQYSTYNCPWLSTWSVLCSLPSHWRHVYP